MHWSVVDTDFCLATSSAIISKAYDDTVISHKQLPTYKGKACGSHALRLDVRLSTTLNKSRDLAFLASSVHLAVIVYNIRTRWQVARDHAPEVTTSCILQNLVRACTHHVQHIARAKRQPSRSLQATGTCSNAKLLARLAVERKDQINVVASHKPVAVRALDNATGTAPLRKVGKDAQGGSCLCVELEDLVAALTGHVKVVVGSDSKALRVLQSSAAWFNNRFLELSSVGI